MINTNLSFIHYNGIRIVSDVNMVKHKVVRIRRSFRQFFTKAPRFRFTDVHPTEVPNLKVQMINNNLAVCHPITYQELMTASENAKELESVLRDRGMLA